MAQAECLFVATLQDNDKQVEGRICWHDGAHGKTHGMESTSVMSKSNDNPKSVHSHMDYMILYGQ